MDIEKLYETYCLQGSMPFYKLSNYDDDDDYEDGHTDEDGSGFCYDEYDHLDTY